MNCGLVVRLADSHRVRPADLVHGLSDRRTPPAAGFISFELRLYGEYGTFVRSPRSFRFVPGRTG
jgi:hypothetical protein